MEKNDFLNFIRGVKAYNVISEHVSFQKHNMSDKFLEFFENLENNIFIHESVDKIRFNKKQFICLFVIDNKDYLNEISDKRSYFFNVIYAFEKHFDKQIDRRQFSLYKDKKNKILHRYSIKLGDLVFFDIDAKQVIAEFKKYFSLEFVNVSGGINNVKDILTNSNKAHVWRLDA